MKKIFLISWLIFLSACNNSFITTTNILYSQTKLYTLGSTVVAFTPTKTTLLPSNTNTLIPTLTQTQFAKTPSDQIIPSPSIKTATPAFRSTPTRGLPPTSTLSKQESCPPPNYTKVDIQFSSTVEGYGPQIVKYLQSKGDKEGLQAQLEHFGINEEKTNPKTGKQEMVFFQNTIRLFEADMTGDKVKETIAVVKQLKSLPNNFPAMGVFVIGCRDNQYQLIGNLIFDFYPDGDEFTRLVDIADLNADGINEMVISYGTGVNPGSISVYSFVFEWNGFEFRSLLDTSTENGDPSGNWSDWNLPMLKDMDGNGTIELLLPRYRHYVCEELETRWSAVYMWNGEWYRYMWTDPGDPVFRFQAAFSGDYYSAIRLYDRAEISYRRAINDSSLRRFSSSDWREKNNTVECNWYPYEPDEPQRIIAYGRLRLLELMVYLNKSDAALSLVQYFEDNFSITSPGYRFASIGIVFWNAYKKQNSIDDACSAVRKEASQYSDEIITSLQYETGGFSTPTIENICPFQS